MNLENTVLVTHVACMDGSTCAILFLAAGGKFENVYFSNPDHAEVDELVNYHAETHDGPILLADISISLRLAEKLDRRPADISILDHHKSAEPLKKFKWCEIDLSRAGGKLMYDYLGSLPIARWKSRNPWLFRELVELADDYDRFVRQYPKSEQLVTLHDFIHQQEFIERFLRNPEVTFSEKELWAINMCRAKRERFIERKMKEALIVSKKIDGHTVKVALVEAGTHQSLLGTALNSSGMSDIAVMVNSRAVSFRASDTCPVDVSKIAGLNEGGGHEKAAAAGLGGILGEPFTEFVFDRITWE